MLNESLSEAQHYFAKRNESSLRKTSFLDLSTLQILLYLTAKEIKKPKKQLIKTLKSRFLTELPEQKNN